MTLPATVMARMIFLAGFVLLLCLPHISKAATGDVTGVVQDKTTRSALAGAQVSSSDKQAVTDRNGRYTLTGITTGNRVVYISAPNYMPASVPIVIKAREQITAPAANLSSTSPVINGASNRIPWNGKNWFLLGNNYPWWNYGTDFGNGGFGKFTDFGQVGSDLATMHSQKVRVTRWFVFADGRYSPKFDASGLVTGLDTQFYSDVNTVLKFCHDNNIYLVLNLADFLMWTGPRSSGTVTGGGHSALVTDMRTQMTYLDNAVKPFLQFVANSPYKNQVLAYDIVNEPEYTINETRGGGLPLAQVQTFVQNCASYIHQYGGGAYATLGSGTPYWVGLWKGLGLDFYQLHYYPNFDPANPGSGLPPYANLNLDRPCIVGEFATNVNSYTIGDTTPLSAQWHLDTIYNYGYAGALGWSYQYNDYVGNWNPFAPVLTHWANGHSAVAGPQ